MIFSKTFKNSGMHPQPGCVNKYSRSKDAPRATVLQVQPINDYTMNSVTTWPAPRRWRSQDSTNSVALRAASPATTAAQQQEAGRETGEPSGGGKRILVESTRDSVSPFLRSGSRGHTGQLSDLLLHRHPTTRPLLHFGSGRGQRHVTFY